MPSRRICAEQRPYSGSTVKWSRTSRTRCSSGTHSDRRDRGRCVCRRSHQLRCLRCTTAPCYANDPAQVVGGPARRNLRSLRVNVRTCGRMLEIAVDRNLTLIRGIRICRRFCAAIRLIAAQWQADCRSTLLPVCCALTCRPHDFVGQAAFTVYIEGGPRWLTHSPNCPTRRMR